MAPALAQIQDIAPGRGADSAAALLRLSLTTGDERLALNPATGRNKYGVPPDCAEDELWFSSSTASPISARGREAALASLEDWLLSPRADLREWPDRIRARLHRLFGIPGSSVILAGSGTEAELIVLALAAPRAGAPVTNVLVASNETGSGVPLAAAGRHFLGTASCKAQVAVGERLEGFGADQITVTDIPIRDGRGDPLRADAVDTEVIDRATGAAKQGRTAIVHLLDCSKTGLQGLSRDAACDLAMMLPDQGVVVVDACQLRGSPEQIREDLAAGRIVILTGSKLVGGPAFCAAVLTPPGFLERIDVGGLPAGLGAYSARHDWPEHSRGALAFCESDLNTPLYVRWEAALAELEAYAAVPRSLRNGITAAFAEGVARLIERTERLELLPMPCAGAGPPRTIHPVVTRGVSAEGVAGVHRTLVGRGLHLGQPVRLGEEAVLRICLSAPDITEAAARLSGGLDLDAALGPFMDRLDVVVSAWDREARSNQRPGAATP